MQASIDVTGDVSDLHTAGDSRRSGVRTGEVACGLALLAYAVAALRGAPPQTAELLAGTLGCLYVFQHARPLTAGLFAGVLAIVSPPVAVALGVGVGLTLGRRAWLGTALAASAAVWTAGVRLDLTAEGAWPLLTRPGLVFGLPTHAGVAWAAGLVGPAVMLTLAARRLSRRQIDDVWTGDTEHLWRERLVLAWAATLPLITSGTPLRPSPVDAPLLLIPAGLLLRAWRRRHQEAATRDVGEPTPSDPWLRPATCALIAWMAATLAQTLSPAATGWTGIDLAATIGTVTATLLAARAVRGRPVGRLQTIPLPHPAPRSVSFEQWWAETAGAFGRRTTLGGPQRRAA